MGEKLLVRGPKAAETVVKLLAEHKVEVLAALALGASTSERGDQESAVDVKEARRWHDRLATRIVDSFHGDRRWEEARRLAWVTWRTNGTNSTVGAGPRGNAQAATRRSPAGRR